LHLSARETHRERGDPMFYPNVEKLYELQGDKGEGEFAKELGISRSQLWRVKKGISPAGAAFIANFMRRYPDKKLEDYFFYSERSVGGTKTHTRNERPAEGTECERKENEDE